VAEGGAKAGSAWRQNLGARHPTRRVAPHCSKATTARGAAAPVQMASDRRRNPSRVLAGSGRCERRAGSS